MKINRDVFHSYINAMPWDMLISALITVAILLMIEDTQLVVKIMIGLWGIAILVIRLWDYKVFRKIEEVLDDLSAIVNDAKEEKKFQGERKLLLKKKAKE